MRVREVNILFLYAKSYSLDLKIPECFDTRKVNKKQPRPSLQASETHRDQPCDVSDSTHYIEVLNVTVTELYLESGGPDLLLSLSTTASSSCSCLGTTALSTRRSGNVN